MYFYRKVVQVSPHGKSKVGTRAGLGAGARSQGPEQQETGDQGRDNEDWSPLAGAFLADQSGQWSELQERADGSLYIHGLGLESRSRCVVWTKVRPRDVGE